MRLAAVWAVAQKELFHIVRDPFTLALAFGMPVVMVLFFGFAIEFNMDRIPMAVFNADGTASSRFLERAFTGSRYFVPHQVKSPAEALQLLDEGRVHAALMIPPGFEKDWQPKMQASVQILVDGTDNSSAGSILGYLGGLQKIAMEKRFGAENIKEPIEIQTRFLFNPELDSQWFVVPGLAAVIMALLSILLTSLTVAREWENGSMELLLGTPVRPFEIIVGKLFPYWVGGAAAVVFVFIMSQIVFQLPFEGSLILYFFCSLIFLVTYLAQGLLISVLTRTQQASMQFAMLTGLLPTVLLSGFIFPVEHMPNFFYYFTMILPARWFIQISRALYLQGSSWTDILPSILALSFLCAIMLAVATTKFKKDVEP